ncbi:MAG: FxSxx-COOH system tetratricopeptide repeat protein, partial [Methanofollis sp.]|nr:FxSxx-COOH system tetratricopeptide repeat protein [Methanofollis sp.]
MGAIIESILAGVIVNALFFMLNGAAEESRNTSLREKIESRKDELQSTFITSVSPLVQELEGSDKRDQIESFLKSDETSKLVQKILTRIIHRSKDSLSSIQRNFYAAYAQYVDVAGSFGVPEKLWRALLDGCEVFLQDTMDDEELKTLASIISIQHEEIIDAVDDIPRKTVAEFQRQGFAIKGEPKYPIRDLKHPRNKNFTGREDLLKDLRQALTDSRSAVLIQAINGLGGVGKTQLAVEYAYQYWNDYDIIWLLRSDDPATIADDYSRLASCLHLQVEDPENIPATVDAVRIFLARHASWLLIFDNAPSQDAIQQFLPETTTGHVLITSRHRDWQCAAGVRVDTFRRSESIQFILRRTGQDDEEAADELAEELGDLPLALEQAGAFIAETGMPTPDYLNAYREKRLKLLEKRKPYDYLESVATTWEISFQKIREDPDVGPVAEGLLNFCAFFAPDNIPLDMIIQGSEYLPPDLSQACLDESLLYESIGVIRRYSLIEKQGDTLSIHRLVQEVIRNRMNEDASWQWCEAAVQIVNAAFPAGSEDPQTWPECSLLLPHVLSVTEYAEEMSIAQTELVWLLNQSGLYLKARAEFLESKNTFETALVIGEGVYGSENPAVAAIINNLGLALLDLGDLKGAKTAFKRALKIGEKVYGPAHPAVATFVNNLGGVLRELDDLEGAKEAFERALEIDETVYGPAHPAVAIRVNNLGSVLRELGNLEGAKEAFERALEIDEKVYG